MKVDDGCQRGMQDVRSEDSFQLNKVRLAAVLLVVSWLSGMVSATPVVKAVYPSEAGRVGQGWPVVCEVSWEGDAGEFVILPAETDGIDWGMVRVSSARSFVRDGQNVVAQTVEFVPNKPGSFTTPEIRIAYLRPEATSPAKKATATTDPSAPDVPPTLRADPSPLTVQPPRSSIWIFGGLGFSLLLLPLGWWSVRFLHRPQPPSSSVGASGVSWAQVQSFLHSAQQHRLDGQVYEYYRALSSAAGLFDAGLSASLLAKAESAGYRGERPQDDELDGDWRGLERAMARAKEESGS